MGLRAWAGFIGTSVFCVVFYVGILPAWQSISSTCLTYGVDPSLLALLEKGLWWAPLMILIAALIHAVVSPSFRPQPTWRDR
jgi:hypothetical protein